MGKEGMDGDGETYWVIKRVQLGASCLGCIH